MYGEALKITSNARKLAVKLAELQGIAKTTQLLPNSISILGMNRIPVMIEMCLSSTMPLAKACNFEDNSRPFRLLDGAGGSLETVSCHKLV